MNNKKNIYPIINENSQLSGPQVMYDESDKLYSYMVFVNGERIGYHFRQVKSTDTVVKGYKIKT